MMGPEQFKKAADEALGGLTAGPQLLHRARRIASRQEAAPVQRRPRRVLALAMSLMLVLVVSSLAFPWLYNKDLFQPDIPVLDTLQAGDAPISGARTAGDLPRGSLVLSKSASPSYQGVWERGSGANFPLIRVEGRYYRLLSNPEDVSGILGSRLGTVQVFTDEPALESGSAILSNVAALNAEVYEVQGLGRAAVAAQVNGRARLFQRVSFAGNALLGNEGLKDTLPGGAVALQLSDVGTVTDPGEVSRLMDLLYKASYQGSGGRTTGQALLVQYGNGVVLQLAVSGDSLYGCGTWAAPDFFAAFTQAAGK